MTTEVEEMPTEAAPEAPWAEEVREWRLRVGEEFRAHLERLMALRGIESIEELHRRFVESEYVYIPIPGLHRGKPVSLEVFRRLVEGRESRYYAELILGLGEILELAEEELGDLACTYIWGETRGHALEA